MAKVYNMWKVEKIHNWCFNLANAISMVINTMVDDTKKYYALDAWFKKLSETYANGTQNPWKYLKIYGICIG